MVSVRYNNNSSLRLSSSSGSYSTGLKMDGVTILPVPQPGAIQSMDIRTCSESPKALKEHIHSCFSLDDPSERLEDSRKRKGWIEDDDIVHKFAKYSYDDGVAEGGLINTRDILLDADTLSSMKFDFGEEKSIYDVESPRDPHMYFTAESGMDQEAQQSPVSKSMGGIEENFLFEREIKTVDTDCGPSFGGKHSTYTQSEVMRWGGSMEFRMPWEEEKTFTMEDREKSAQSGEIEDDSPLAGHEEEEHLDADLNMDADDIPEVLTNFDEKDLGKDDVNKEPAERGWGLPFDVGDEVESRSFQQGFRGAWFECKVVKKEIWQGRRRAKLSYKDFSAEGEHWVCVYQINHTIRKNQDKQKKELMIRPKPPPQVLEGDEESLSGMQGTVVIAKPKWEVGDLVDARIDWCWWTGRVKKLNPDGTLVVAFPKPPDGESGEDTVEAKNVRASLDWINGEWSIRTLKQSPMNKKPSGQLIQLPLELQKAQNALAGSGSAGDLEETGMKAKYSRRLKARKLHNGVFQHEPSDSDYPECWAAMDEQSRNPSRRSKVTKRVIDYAASAHPKFPGRGKEGTQVQAQQSILSARIASDEMEGKESSLLNAQSSADEGSPHVAGSEMVSECVREMEHDSQEFPVHEGGDEMLIKQAFGQGDGISHQSTEQTALANEQTVSTDCPHAIEEEASGFCVTRRLVSSEVLSSADCEGVGEQQRTQRSLSLCETRVHHKQHCWTDDADLIRLDRKQAPEHSPVTETIGTGSHPENGVLYSAEETVRDQRLVGEDQTRVDKTENGDWTVILHRELRADGRGSLCSRPVDKSSHTGLEKVLGGLSENLMDNVLQRSSLGCNKDGKYDDIAEAASGALGEVMETTAARTLCSVPISEKRSLQQDLLAKTQTQTREEEDFCVTSGNDHVRARDEDDECLTAVDITVVSRKTNRNGPDGGDQKGFPSGAVGHTCYDFKPSRKSLSGGAAGTVAQRSRRVAGGEGTTSTNMLERDGCFQKGGNKLVSVGDTKGKSSLAPSSQNGKSSVCKGYSSPKPPGGRRYRRKHFFSRLWLTTEQRELCLGPFVNQAAAQHAFNELSKCASFIGSDSFVSKSDLRCGVFYRLFDGGTAYVGSEKVVASEPQNTEDGKHVARDNTAQTLTDGADIIGQLKGEDVSKLTEWEKFLHVTAKAANSPSGKGERKQWVKVVSSCLDLNVPTLEMSGEADCDEYEGQQDWNLLGQKHEAVVEGSGSAALRGDDAQAESRAGVQYGEPTANGDVLADNFPRTVKSSQIRKLNVVEAGLIPEQLASRELGGQSTRDGVDALLFASRKHDMDIGKTGALAEMDDNLAEAENEGECNKARDTGELSDERKCLRQKSLVSSGSVEKYSVPEDQLVWKVCSGRKRFAHVISYRGVYMHKDGWFYYRSRVHGGSRIRYGRYVTAEEAARGYDEHVKKFHGKSALNFPESKKRSINARSSGLKYGKDWQVEDGVIGGRIGGKHLVKGTAGAGDEGATLPRVSSRKGKGMRKQVEEHDEEAGFEAAAMNDKDAGRKRKWKGGSGSVVKGGLKRGSRMDVDPEVSISRQQALIDTMRMVIARGGKADEGADEALQELLVKLTHELPLKARKKDVEMDNVAANLDEDGGIMIADTGTAHDRLDLLLQHGDLLLQNAGSHEREKEIHGNEKALGSSLRSQSQAVSQACAGEKKTGEKPRRGGRRKFKGWGRKGKRCGAKKKVSDLHISDDFPEGSGYMENAAKPVQEMDMGDVVHNEENVMSPDGALAFSPAGTSLPRTVNGNSQMMGETAAAGSRHDNQAKLGAEHASLSARGGMQGANQVDDVKGDDNQAAATLLQAGGRSAYDDPRVKRRCARARFTSCIPCLWDSPAKKDFFTFKGVGVPAGSGCTYDRVGGGLIGESSSIAQRIINDDPRAAPVMGGEGLKCLRGDLHHIGVSEGGCFTQEKSGGSVTLLSQTTWFSNPIFPKPPFASHTENSSIPVLDGMEKHTVPWPHHSSSTVEEESSVLDPDGGVLGATTSLTAVRRSDSASDNMAASRMDCALKGADMGGRALQSTPFIPRMLQQMSSNVTRRMGNDMSRISERRRAGKLGEGISEDNSMSRSAGEMWNVNIYYDGTKKHSTEWFTDYSQAVMARDEMIERIRKMGYTELRTAVQQSPPASDKQKEEKGAEKPEGTTKHQTIEWELVDGGGTIVCCGNEEVEWIEKSAIAVENWSCNKRPPGNIQQGWEDVEEDIPGKRKLDMALVRDEGLGNKAGRETGGPQDKEVKEGKMRVIVDVDENVREISDHEAKEDGEGSQEVGQVERQDPWEKHREEAEEARKLTESCKKMEGKAAVDKEGMLGGVAEMQGQVVDKARPGDKENRVDSNREEGGEQKQVEGMKQGMEVGREKAEHREEAMQDTQDLERAEMSKGDQALGMETQTVRRDAGNEEVKAQKSNEQEESAYGGENEEISIKTKVGGGVTAKEDDDRYQEDGTEVGTEGLRDEQVNHREYVEGCKGAFWKGVAGLNGGWLSEEGQSHDVMAVEEGIQDTRGNCRPADANDCWLRKDGQMHEDMGNSKEPRASRGNLIAADMDLYEEPCLTSVLGNDQRGQTACKTGLNRGNWSESKLPSMFVDPAGSKLLPDESRSRQGSHDDGQPPNAEKGRRKGHLTAKHRRGL